MAPRLIKGQEQAGFGGDRRASRGNARQAGHSPDDREPIPSGSSKAGLTDGCGALS